MVPFAGYAMPVQYEGIIVEHRHCREAAGLFDVSHMGQALMRGENVAADFESLVPGDILGLGEGRIRYTMLTTDGGGIIDDLLVTSRGPHLAIVVNAARKEVDYAHIRERLNGRCTLELLEDRALLALQGPAAKDVMGRLAPASRHMIFMTAEQLRVGDIPCTVSRSGYTGEDGFEISVPADKVENLARHLLDESEVKLIGLGARDSLRLEAGLCLYGSDIDETTSPVEAGLTWAIGKRRRAEGGFPGADIILRHLAEGTERRRVGLRAGGKVPARARTAVTDADGDPIGEVTSGGFGPTAGGPVAMGYVKSEFATPETPVNFMVRGKALPGAVAALPFVAHRYAKS